MDEDEEYDDELPSISVNSTRHKPGKFCMPSAEELASQRAREEECERELRALREAEARGDHVAGLAAARCDSSGSEGEAGLAAAVSALAVHVAAAPRTDRAVRSEPAAVAALGASLAAGSAESAAGDDVAAAAAWLCAQLSPAGHLRAGAGTARRALHRLLVDAGTAHMPAIARAVLAGVRPARARLDVVDALLAARAEPAAALLAGLLCRAALTHLLEEDASGDTVPSSPASPAEVARLAGEWRRRPPDEAYLTLQLAARALLVPAPAPAAPRPAPAALQQALAALAQPPNVPLAQRHRPEYLKVVVAAAKLQLLLGQQLTDTTHAL